MWNIHGKAAPVDRVPSLEPVEVLYDFDGPRIYTTLDAEGELNLAFWSDGDQEHWRYVVVPTTPAIVAALRAGRVSVLDALNQPRCWVFDTDATGTVRACHRVDFESIPRDALPAAGTMLLPTHEPLARLAANGDAIDLEGRVRELDKDRLSFELREIAGPMTVQQFVFDRELLDDVIRALRDDVRVKVAGRRLPAKSVAYALALSRG